MHAPKPGDEDFRKVSQAQLVDVPLIGEGVQGLTAIIDGNRATLTRKASRV